MNRKRGNKLAQLRDRYSQHGFDDDDNISKQFNQLKKALVENTKAMTKFNQSNNLAKNTAGALADSAKGAFQLGAKGAQTDVARAGMAVLGPTGYLLAKAIPHIASFTKWIGSFKMDSAGSKKLNTQEQFQAQSNATDKNKQKELEKKEDDRAKKLFESYPTITRLRAHLDYQAKNDPALLKMQLKYYTDAKKRMVKEEAEVKKQQEILNNMNKELQWQGLQTKLVVAGVMLGIAGIAALALWFKTHTIKVRFPWQKDPEEEKKEKEGKEAEEGNKLTKQERKDYEKQGISTNAADWMKVTGSSEEHVKKHGGDTSKKYQQLGWGGIDIGAKNEWVDSIKGKPCKALYKGKVIVAAFGASDVLAVPGIGTKGFGNVVVTSTNLTLDDKVYYKQTKKYLTGELRIIYGHLDSISDSISKGASVQRGTEIGKIGNTGKSEGPHLHISVIHHNPAGQWEPLMVDRIVWGYGDKTTLSTYDLIVAINSQAEKNAQNKTQNGDSVVNTTQPSSSQPNFKQPTTGFGSATWGGLFSSPQPKSGSGTGSNLDTTGKNDTGMQVNNLKINQAGKTQQKQPQSTPLTASPAWKSIPTSSTPTSTSIIFANTPGSHLDNRASGNSTANVGQLK